MLLNQVSPPRAGISTRRGFAPRALVRGRVERAEMPRERQQIVVRQSLVPEHQHVVPIPRALDGVDLHPGGVGEIDTPDLGAKDTQGKDLEAEYNF